MCIFKHLAFAAENTGENLWFKLLFPTFHDVELVCLSL